MDKLKKIVVVEYPHHTKSFILTENPNEPHNWRDIWDGKKYEDIVEGAIFVHEDFLVEN